MVNMLVISLFMSVGELFCGGFQVSTFVTGSLE